MTNLHTHDRQQLLQVNTGVFRDSISSLPLKFVMLDTDFHVNFEQQQKHEELQTSQSPVLNITFPVTKQMANINK